MPSYEINDLLQLILSESADGLTLHPGQPPVVEFRGEPNVVEGPAITPENANELFRALAGTRRMRELRQHHQLTFVHTCNDSARFKVQALFRDDTVYFDLRRLAP